MNTGFECGNIVHVTEFNWMKKKKATYNGWPRWKWSDCVSMPMKMNVHKVRSASTPTHKAQIVQSQSKKYGFRFTSVLRWFPVSGIFLFSSRRHSAYIFFCLALVTEWLICFDFVSWNVKPQIYNWCRYPCAAFVLPTARCKCNQTDETEVVD